MQGMFAPARLLMCGCKSQLQCHDIIGHDYTLLLTAAMLSCISRTFLRVCPCSLKSKALRHVQPHLYNVVAWLKMQIVLLPCPPPPPLPPPPLSCPPPPPPLPLPSSSPSSSSSCCSSSPLLLLLPLVGDWHTVAVTMSARFVLVRLRQL